jgi:hypothetical protein
VKLVTGASDIKNMGGAIIRVAWALTVVVCIAVSVGCSSEPVPKRPSAPPPKARVRLPAAAPELPIPSIKSVTPDTVQVRRGHAESDSYEVEYKISNSGLVTKAELEVYAPGVGVVQRIPVSPEDEGIITFDLDTSTDLGPKIAFRVQCPEGQTNLYVLGTDRGSDSASDRSGLRITGVGPTQINLDRALVAGNGDLPQGSGIPVTIFGPELTSECKPIATVDGREVELKNVFAQKRQIRALLMYDDFGGRYVSSRYLEVKLSVRGDGFARVNIAKIRFVE